MPVSPIDIRPVRYHARVARTLVDAAMADLTARYGGPDETLVHPEDFDPPEGTVLVAWLAGQPVGCGGWRAYHGSPEVAEIKRMYTVPAVRGRGVGMAILTAVEDSARRLGRVRAILETGERQPEAVNLYKKAGYVPIEKFGYYRDHSGSICLGRDL